MSNGAVSRIKKSANLSFPSARSGIALTIEESDRVVRLTRIQSLAEDVFGDQEKANRWLREKLAILDGKPPLEVAQTETGARVIEQILAKIDWGAAA
jgi:putative toxin-antitoxin system antitoxin component (TIGR02293 family)